MIPVGSSTDRTILGVGVGWGVEFLRDAFFKVQFLDGDEDLCGVRGTWTSVEADNVRA